MPQLDKLTVVSNVFWFSLCFLLFYILLLKYASPRLVRLVMFRRLAWESPRGRAEGEPKEQDPQLESEARSLGSAPAQSAQDYGGAPTGDQTTARKHGSGASALGRVFSRALAPGPGAEPSKLQGAASKPMGDAVKLLGALSARGQASCLEQKSTKSPRAILSVYKRLLFRR